MTTASKNVGEETYTVTLSYDELRILKALCHVGKENLDLTFKNPREVDLVGEVSSKIIYSN